MGRPSRPMECYVLEEVYSMTVPYFLQIMTLLAPQHSCRNPVGGPRRRTMTKPRTQMHIGAQEHKLVSLPHTIFVRLKPFNVKVYR